ncbi:hypothetical protein D9615_000361 [Tricholomella constricta]|uniref:DUF302 domain-containing protein n=1 Tax=Tricholomella constricta TaxID=117010 RepID=A0A8H5HRQ4_9AGAR|nr:hypothetical protein D9615_000361 [Tricholomella constricta]
MTCTPTGPTLTSALLMSYDGHLKGSINFCQMKKTVTPFTVQLVTFETNLPFEEVIARLDEELNKQGSLQFLSKFRTATTREEIVDLITNITGNNDFLYFLEMNHHKWMNIYEEAHNPPAVVYTIGNPLTAETILRHDIRTGYNIPPRLMVIERADRSGTSVLYHLPSSLVVGTRNAELEQAILVLDDKLEKMITRVTAD